MCKVIQLTIIDGTAQPVAVDKEQAARHPRELISSIHTRLFLESDYVEPYAWAKAALQVFRQVGAILQNTPLDTPCKPTRCGQCNDCRNAAH